MTKLQRRIEVLLAHWRPILGLSEWAIEVRYNETEHLGFCIAKPSYLEAVIGFNMKRIKKECRTPEALEDLVVHELCHCVIWKSSERAVSQMTMALLRAAGRKLT